MPIQIRRGTDADLAKVLALWRDGDAHPTHTDDVHNLGNLLAYDGDALILATAEDGRIVGSVIAAWDGWRGTVYRLVVAPTHRRQGLGRQLIHAAEERFRQAKAVRLQAVVVETDQEACAFWRSTQWREQVERIRFVTG